MKKNFSLLFILCGLCMLVVGALIGVLTSLVYLYPDFFKEVLPFNQLRPLHTTSVVSWIVLTATGGVYYYIGRSKKVKLFSSRLGVLHLFIFACVAFGILFSLVGNKMGGKGVHGVSSCVHLANPSRVVHLWIQLF